MMDLGIVFALASPYTVALVVPMLLWAGFKNKYKVYFTPLNLCLLGLFIWAGISGIQNRSWFSLFGSAAILVYLIISVFFQNYFSEGSQIEFFLRKIHKFSLITAGFGLLEKLSSLFVDMTWVSHFFWSPTYIPSKEAYRIYSTFGNPNVAGDWFALLALISVYFLEQSPYKKKGFYAFSMFVYIAVLLFTGSKGSVIGLIGGLIVFAVFSKKKKTKWVIGLTVVAIIGVMFFLPELNRPSNYRNALWIKSMMLYKNHAITGVGLFGIFDRTGEIHAHNIWISILAMFGIVGFGLFIGMKLYLYNSLLKLKEVGCTLMPLLASVQALIFAHGLVDFTIMTPQGGLMFIAAGGLITALMKPHETYGFITMEIPQIPNYSDLPMPHALYQAIKTEQSK